MMKTIKGIWKVMATILFYVGVATIWASAICLIISFVTMGKFLGEAGIMAGIPFGLFVIYSLLIN